MKILNQSRVKCLSLAVIALLCLTVSCTSPVEKYIQNEFATTVRLDALDTEIDGKIKSIADSLNQISYEANPDAAESRRLAQSAERGKRDIESRLRNYKRTGSYHYIVGIASDVEKADADYANSQRLKRKAQPFINHTKKQVDAFVKALKDVDSEKLLLSTKLVKNNEISVDSIFNTLVGTPANMANPTKETIDNIALITLTNYFVENPTPTPKAYEFKESDDQWYILLSDDTEYFLKAIKCNDGEYDYRYSKIESDFVPAGNKSKSDTKE